MTGDAVVDGCRHLDVVVFGNDSSLLHRLLAYAASVSERDVIHSSHNQLGAAVVRDQHASGAAFIEGTSLLVGTSLQRHSCTIRRQTDVHFFGNSKPVSS